jgi:hypothetical protein
MAKPGENPALNYLHPHLDLGFIAWFGGSSWDDGKAKMVSQLQVGPIDLGFIAMRALDGGLEIVGHHDLRHPTDGVKGSHMGANPVGQTLCPAHVAGLSFASA